MLCSKRFHFALDPADYVANLAVGSFLMALPPPSTGTFPGSYHLPHSRERPKPACSTGSLESTKAAPDPLGALTAHQPCSASWSECAANPAALQQSIMACWLLYPPALYWTHFTSGCWQFHQGAITTALGSRALLRHHHAGGFFKARTGLSHPNSAGSCNDSHLVRNRLSAPVTTANRPVL